MKQYPFKHVNYRVVIDTERHPWIDDKKDSVLTGKLLRDTTEDLRKVLAPVVDAIGWHYGEPRIEHDTVCRFCDYPWKSALDDDGKPACCDDAIAEWERANTSMATSADIEKK